MGYDEKPKVEVALKENYKKKMSRNTSLCC